MEDGLGRRRVGELLLSDKTWVLVKKNAPWCRSGGETLNHSFVELLMSGFVNEGMA